MIRLTEEPYEGEIAGALVTALNDEINVRYAAEMADWTEAEITEEVVGFLAEVTAEMVRRPNGVFVVAWLDGEPVGCGAVKPFHLRPGVAEIKRMYTAPPARRRGVSRALLRRLEELATELGYLRIQLETGTEQPEAVALYESAGWHRITPYGRYKDSPSSICFAKDLDGP